MQSNFCSAKLFHRGGRARSLSCHFGRDCNPPMEIGGISTTIPNAKKLHLCSAIPMKIINYILQVTGYRLMLLFIICNLQLATCNSFAQQNKIDSLLLQLETLNLKPETFTRDTSRVNSLNSLAWLLQHSE